MKNELGTQSFRKLNYYFENKIMVHFKLYSGGWKNGTILDLNENKLTLVLNERIEGELPFLCEDVITESIKPFTEKPE